MSNQTTKELQAELVTTMKRWQKIEDASVASTGRIIEQTDNPLIRLVMEIIQRDSQMHHRVQALIAGSLESAAISLKPEEMTAVWESIEKHIELEKQMVGFVEETLETLKGRKMLVQEYLLHYLRTDEKKHDELLEALEGIKKGMYPYAS
ncbi:MAG: hypothetical protein PVF43_10890 [Candidatus Eiseniibacteriota bacterium]